MYMHAKKHVPAGITFPFFLLGLCFSQNVKDAERGGKMGKDKVKETMRAFSIDFISAFPLLNRRHFSNMIADTGTAPRL